MANNYNDLTEKQKDNLKFFLNKANSHELSKLKIKFKVKQGRDLTEFKNNTVNDLMFDLVNFEYFMNWLAHLNLEGNNTLFVYEPEDNVVFEKDSLETILNKFKKKTTFLYNLDIETLKKVQLVNVYKPDDKEQIIFTFAAPAQVQYKSKETGLAELEQDIYLAYIIMDYELKHFVLSMHPSDNLVSINGELKKKELDRLTWIFLHNFKKNILHFESSNPSWVLDSLCLITEEYFYHNNKKIEQQVEQFKKTVAPTLLSLLKKHENLFDRKDSMLRLERSLVSAYENELVVLHGRIEKQLPFELFFQQSGKGITEFKANSKGSKFSHADTADIIKLMSVNGDIYSLGLIHQKEANGVKKPVPYILSKHDKYYSLKRFSTASTEKEVVDDVLRKLNTYKQKVRLTSSSVEATG